MTAKNEFGRTKISGTCSHPSGHRSNMSWATFDDHFPNLKFDRETRAVAIATWECVPFHTKFTNSIISALINLMKNAKVKHSTFIQIPYHSVNFLLLHLFQSVNCNAYLYRYSDNREKWFSTPLLNFSANKSGIHFHSISPHKCLQTNEELILTFWIFLCVRNTHTHKRLKWKLK